MALTGVTRGLCFSLPEKTHYDNFKDCELTYQHIFTQSFKKTIRNITRGRINTKKFFLLFNESVKLHFSGKTSFT